MRQRMTRDTYLPTRATVGLGMGKQRFVAVTTVVIACLGSVVSAGEPAYAQIAGSKCTKVGTVSANKKYRCVRKGKTASWATIRQVPPRAGVLPQTTIVSSANKLLYGTTPCVFFTSEPKAPIRSFSSPFKNCTSNEDSISVQFDTNVGLMKFVLLHDAAPGAVNNFVNLSRARFYDGTYVHRDIQDFVFQGGDPTAVNENAIGQAGSGGPGYVFDDELPGPSAPYRVGDLLMANAGPNTNGSQFFVITGKLGEELPRLYTRFGTLDTANYPQGLVTLDAIKAVANLGDGPPKKPVLLRSVEVFIVSP
jgi:cyclophilin family peptidyl-prolyl cis-trans isomerase